jgi:hypothetical protein
MKCTFVDVGFEEVAMRNNLIAATTLSDCSITGSIFGSASWPTTFSTVANHSAFSSVESTMSNCTYIIYAGIMIKDLIETYASGSLIGRSNLGAIPKVVQLAV